MEMDILAMLMVAFGLFAILMFILFYAYVKKYYNEKHLTEDYNDSLGEEIDLVNIIIDNKNYVFDANDYNLIKDENVRVLIDNKVYDGKVIRGNYIGNTRDYQAIPSKLVLQEERENNKEDINNIVNSKLNYVNEEVNYLENNMEKDDDNKDYDEVSLSNKETYDMEDFIPRKKNTL